MHTYIGRDNNFSVENAFVCITNSYQLHPINPMDRKKAVNIFSSLTSDLVKSQIFDWIQANRKMKVNNVNLFYSLKLLVHCSLLFSLHSRRRISWLGFVNNFYPFIFGKT